MNTKQLASVLEEGNEQSLIGKHIKITKNSDTLTNNDLTYNKLYQITEAHGNQLFFIDDIDALNYFDSWEVKEHKVVLVENAEILTHAEVKKLGKELRKQANEFCKVIQKAREQGFIIDLNDNDTITIKYNYPTESF